MGIFENYLKNELRMYWWVQIPLEEAIRFNIDSGGYKYMLPEDSSSMVKFHVDVHRSFQETMYLTEFGGNEGLRKPKCDKIIILFEHKKYILNKDTYSIRCWSG